MIRCVHPPGTGHSVALLSRFSAVGCRARSGRSRRGSRVASRPRGLTARQKDPTTESEARIMILDIVSIAVSLLATQAPSVLVKEKEIALEGEGSWDYVAVDPDAGRAYLAHATRIDVIDTR